MRVSSAVLALVVVACQSPGERVSAGSTPASSGAPVAVAVSSVPAFPPATIRTPEELLVDPVFQVLKIGSARSAVEARLGPCALPLSEPPELTCRYPRLGAAIAYRDDRVIRFTLFRRGRALAGGRTERYAGARWALGRGLRLGGAERSFLPLGAPTQILYPVGDPQNPDKSEQVEVWEYRAARASLVLDRKQDGSRVVGAIVVPIAAARARPAGDR